MEQQDIDRIIEMAWEDRTPFEAIKMQFNFSEADVIALMRRELKRSSFNLWRKRVNSGISQKHALKRNPEIVRFKSSLQNAYK
ncbi:TIGR03643 family protein [bacterium]|nr:TIGR03643 family protein [bacterium]